MLMKGQGIRSQDSGFREKQKRSTVGVYWPGVPCPSVQDAVNRNPGVHEAGYGRQDSGFREPLALPDLES